MKLTTTIQSLASGLSLALLVTLSAATGCSKKPAVDTVNLQYIQAAEPATQASITEAVEDIEKADYNTALEKLKKASADPKLTADQKKTVAGVIDQLEKR